MLALQALSALPARANVSGCNTTENLVGVSVGYRESDKWMSEGWWRIPPGDCASVIEGTLSARYFYLHAEDSVTGGQWRGPVFMCTSSKEFKIEGLENCFARGHERAGFFEVDTGKQTNWQVRLNPGQARAPGSTGSDTEERAPSQ